MTTLADLDLAGASWVDIAATRAIAGKRVRIQNKSAFGVVYLSDDTAQPATSSQGLALGRFDSWEGNVTANLWVITDGGPSRLAVEVVD